MIFLSNINVLYTYQSGFPRFYSTYTCLSYLHDKVTKGFDSGLLTEMILIDLQKAFDTIDHNSSDPHITRFLIVVAKKLIYQVDHCFEMCGHTADDKSKFISQASQLTLALHNLKLVIHFYSIIISNQIKYYLATNRGSFCQIPNDSYRHAFLNSKPAIIP